MGPTTIDNDNWESAIRKRYHASVSHSAWLVPFRFGIPQTHQWCWAMGGWGEVGCAATRAQSAHPRSKSKGRRPQQSRPPTPSRGTQSDSASLWGAGGGQSPLPRPGGCVWPNFAGGTTWCQFETYKREKQRFNKKNRPADHVAKFIPSNLYRDREFALQAIRWNAEVWAELRDRATQLLE